MRLFDLDLEPEAVLDEPALGDLALAAAEDRSGLSSILLGVDRGVDEADDDESDEISEAIVVALFFISSLVVRLSRESVLNQSSHEKL